MSEKNELTPAERELEEALRSLTPATVEIDPVAAAFKGGRRWARRRLRLWQSVAIALLVVSTVAWLLPRGNRVVEKEDMARVTPAVEPDSVITDASDDMLTTIMAYRRALRRSSQELETLLDKQALIASQREGQLVENSALVTCNLELRTRTGGL